MDLLLLWMPSDESSVVLQHAVGQLGSGFQGAHRIMKGEGGRDLAGDYCMKIVGHCSFHSVYMDLIPVLCQALG